MLSTLVWILKSLSLYLTYLSVPIYLSIYLSIHVSIYLAIYLSTCLSISRAIYVSSNQSNNQSIQLSMCHFVYVSICLFIYLSVYCSIHPSMYLFVHLCIYPSIYRSIFLRSMPRIVDAYCNGHVAVEPRPVSTHIVSRTCAFGGYSLGRRTLQGSRSYRVEPNRTPSHAPLTQNKAQMSSG